MSKIKYLEMEDITYKEWSDHLDFVAASRASSWLPAYGYHPPSPVQEVFQSDTFQSENSPNQQQYLVLETIVEETSDDLCSESDRSGPIGWNSDSDTDSVIHMPKTDVGVEWRERDCGEEVPKKRRCRTIEKSYSDDDESHENVESTSLSSRSSSLLAFESLEKHCEDIFVTAASSDSFGWGTRSELSRKNRGKSPDGSGESRNLVDSSDEDWGKKSSADPFHGLFFCGSSFRSSRSARGTLKPYRSFDSLNLFENLSPLTYAVAEISQSQSALDYEKAKEEEEKDFVVRNRKLTATTADLTTMADSYEGRLFSPKKSSLSFRRKQDTASFHYKEHARFPNPKCFFDRDAHKENYFALPEGKSLSAEGLKLDVTREQSEAHANSEPCLNAPPGSHRSVENLSEDSGFDDEISRKNKSRRKALGNSATNILSDEDSSPSEWSGSSRYSDSIGSEEGAAISPKSHDHSKFLNKSHGLKIDVKRESEVRGSFAEKNDAEVNFNPGPEHRETQTFNCGRNEEEVLFREFEGGDPEKLIATPSVAFASLASKEFAESFCDFDIRPRPEFITFCKGKQSFAKEKISSSECSSEDPSILFPRPNDFFYEAIDEMNAKLEKNNPGLNRQMASRFPVLSTPNLLAEDEVFVRGIPSAASSLTHVPLKCYDGSGIDEEELRNEFYDLRKNQLRKEFGSQNTSTGIKGVHFCPVVSELSWQESYSDEDSSSASSDPSTDEISNRSLEEFCALENEDEDFEVEEKSIFTPEMIPETYGKEKHTSKVLVENNESEEGKMNVCRGCNEPETTEPKGVESEKVRNEGRPESGDFGGNEARDKKKPVPPTNRETPTSFDHVSLGDAAQTNAERTRLSVSESDSPTDHASLFPRQFDCLSSSGDAVAPVTTMTTKKSKGRFGGFLERFSFRRLSNRKTSGGNSKKQGVKKEQKKGKSPRVNATDSEENKPEDVTIIPLHGPEIEAEIKEIFRSVVSPHVVSAKPPLPPHPQRMSVALRKRSPPSGTESVELQDVETNEKKNMPGFREAFPKDDDGAIGSLTKAKGDDNVERDIGKNSKHVGLLETDLDTHITVESAGRGPSVQCNVGNQKKARSLINLGLGGLSVHQDRERESPSSFMEPPPHRSNVSVAVDDRAKSMEFLLDKENQVAALPPENELQKGGAGDRVMSEHQLRVQRSLQKLNIPDWYKSSAVSQTPQGFLLKRNSESRKEHQGWPGLSSKTTSLSSLGSSQSASAKSPTGYLLSPSPSPGPHVFTRWSTSRLNSGVNSSSTSPSGSARSSFNYRQPYLGWRSQEKLTRPRTPAERLAAGLLPLQKFSAPAQSNSQPSANPNLTDVRTSIKEVTSAIVHYVSGVRENGSTEALRNRSGASSSPSPKWQSSPRGSSGRLCWLESSFVGSRPLDQPETPSSLTESTSLKPESRTNELYLDLKPRPQVDHSASHRLNESTSSDERRYEKEFESRTKPSPSSTTLDDILESLLGLPPTSRSPSPGPLSVAPAAASSPGKSRPLLPLPERQHHRHSWGDVRANVSGSDSDPGSDKFAKEMTTRRRKSDGNDDSRFKRQGSNEQKGKNASECCANGKEDSNRKELHPNLTDALVKCRYSKCGKTATVPDAKKTFKTCHNCSHVYCSRECRRAHWERHRRTCLHSRIGALCRQVLAAAKDDPKVLHHLSLLARRGYLTHGRGAVKIFFSSPELAEKFVARGFEELGEPAFVKWSDLLPAEMGADLFAELMKICKSYNPDTRLVLYVAVCVVSEVPTTGAVKWERQLVSRCCKLQLDKTLVPPKADKQVPPPLPPRRSSSESANITLEMENPDTLILTSLPGIAGKMSERKIREISFANIQRELKQRGVSLRRQFPEIYKKLCAYVEGTSDRFTPATIYPRDSVTGKLFMCIIMPDSEAGKLDLVPKDSAQVQTVDVSMERKAGT